MIDAKILQKPAATATNRERDKKLWLIFVWVVFFSSRFNLPFRLAVTSDMGRSYLQKHVLFSCDDGGLTPTTIFDKACAHNIIYQPIDRHCLSSYLSRFPTFGVDAAAAAAAATGIFAIDKMSDFKLKF